MERLLRNISKIKEQIFKFSKSLPNIIEKTIYLYFLLVGSNNVFFYYIFFFVKQN